MSSPVPPALRRPDPIPSSDRLLCSVADFSKATTLSVRTLQKLIAAKTIPALKIGRRVLIDPVQAKAALMAAGDSSPA